MAIDFHCHAFHEKIVDKAVSFLHSYYQIKPQGTGRLADAVTLETRAGCERFILMVSATRPEQVIPANNWAIEINKMTPADFAVVANYPKPAIPIVFGTIHPNFKEFDRELNRLKAAGIRGIKIHPDFQGFTLDSREVYSLYEALGEDFILLTHMGGKNATEKRRNSPAGLSRILRDFPHLKIVAAHLGGYCCWEEAIPELAGRQVFLDLSSTVSFISPSLLKESVNTFGVENLLFGSDYPLADPAVELEKLQNTGLFKASDWEAVTTKNASRLLAEVGIRL